MHDDKEENQDQEETSPENEMLEMLKKLCTAGLNSQISPTTIICLLLDQASTLACELGDNWKTLSSMLRISYERTSADYRRAEVFGRMSEIIARPIVMFEESEDEEESC